ncbi:MAG: DUF72 domain-containing protein [bacterium]
MAEALIGTSGYSYDHWSNGVFYPPRLPRSKWLEHYSQHFQTVELNVTFYRLPQVKAFATWHEKTSDRFRFAVKGSRFITHIKRLTNLGDSLETLAQRLSHLKEKCSVVLWQLPPSMKVDLPRLDGFCKEAQKAIRHRQAFEFRNEAWFSSQVYDILREYNCALCLADWFEQDIREPVTADFVYVRRHGPSGRYAGNYTRRHLRKDAGDMLKWLEQGKDVYVYFNNDVGGYAVQNAKTLTSLIAVSRKL